MNGNSREFETISQNINGRTEEDHDTHNNRLYEPISKQGTIQIHSLNVNHYMAIFALNLNRNRNEI
jgi:hypothetical protein